MYACACTDGAAPVQSLARKESDVAWQTCIFTSWNGPYGSLRTLRVMANLILSPTLNCDAMSISQCFSHRFFHRSSDATTPPVFSSNLKPRSVSSRAFSKTKSTLIPYRLKHSPWHSKGQEKPACPFLASEVGCRFEPFRRGNCALYGICFLPPTPHAMPSRGLCDVSTCKCMNHRTSQGNSHAEYL